MTSTMLIFVYVFTALALVVSIWGIATRLRLISKYRRYNEVEAGTLTAKQVAEKMLAELGYTDIQVRQTSYWWLFFFHNWGNRYSPDRKTIFLYNNIINSKSVTAIAVATQKVGLVIQHKQGERQMEFRAKWELLTRLAPNLLLPIVTLGLFIDLAINNWSTSGGTFGYILAGFAFISIVYTLVAFYCLYLIIPTERRAGVLALQKIKEQKLIPTEHHGAVERLYATYSRAYISDFILAIFGLALDVLWLALWFAESRV